MGQTPAGLFPLQNQAQSSAAGGGLSDRTRISHHLVRGSDNPGSFPAL